MSSVGAKYEGNQYIITRLIFPASVDAEDIDLEVFPSKKQVQLSISRGTRQCTPQIALGLPSTSKPDNLQSFFSSYQAKLRTMKKHQDESIKSTLVFNVPFEPEPRTSRDIPSLKDGHGLKHVEMKLGSKRVKVNTFFFVLKKVESTYSTTKKVGSTVQVFEQASHETSGAASGSVPNKTEFSTASPAAFNVGMSSTHSPKKRKATLGVTALVNSVNSVTEDVEMVAVEK